MEIFIDADACPVKDEAITVAARHALPVTMVSNQGMRPRPQVKNIMVGQEFDAADNWIAEHVAAGDIVITADIQLAGRCVSKDAHAIGPTGHVFTKENIGSALALRELNSYLRETGEITGHNASFSKADRSRFLQSLDKVIQQSKNQS